MKNLYLKQLIAPAALAAVIAVLFGGSNTQKTEAYTAAELRLLVDETCGACHANTHIRPPGEYDLSSGDKAILPGVFATSLQIDNPTKYDGTDPRAAIIIQKPMEGSAMLHGGIKIASTTPVMQALIEWVEAGNGNGADATKLNRPAPIAYDYANPAVGVNQHEIVYTRRRYRREGFNNLLGHSTGSFTSQGLYRIIFTYNPAVSTTPVVGPEIAIVEIGATEDIQSPTISLDGTRVAYALKKPGQVWQIWETNVDGTGSPRQITQSPAGNKIQPVYLPYHPNGDPARDGSGGIAYLTDVTGFRDEYDQAATLALFVCDTNGGNVRQIDFNPSHGLGPTLHSSGMLIYTRWQHNEHQGHNFMPLHQISISDYMSAGTNLFGAYGEHYTSPAGNSLHEAVELVGPIDPSYNVSGSEISDKGWMIARGSGRDDEGGSIVGPFYPRLQGEATGAGRIPNTEVMVQGDNSENRAEMMMMMNISSETLREPASLLNGIFVMSRAPLESEEVTFNTFTMSSETMRIYGNFALEVFSVDADMKIEHRAPLLVLEKRNVDEAVPVLVRPQPPKIGKPIDLNKFNGTLTSGDVTDRGIDGQPRSFQPDDVSFIRFIRALQLSQGRVDTGKQRGISTQIIGEAEIASDGSFSALVPANVPMQFQLIDNNGQVLVNHKPWFHVAPGATERCVGCHARHDKPAAVQSLEARELPSQNVEARRVTQFHFHQDIQPILNENCISCHDSAAVNGAAGYNPNRPGSQAISLVGRFTPANVTEAYETLTGISRERSNSAYVRTQSARRSPLMHWLTGLKLDATPPTSYPNPAALVDHTSMLTEEELDKITRWIDTGTNFRVVTDNVPNPLQELSHDTYTARIWPIMENRGCVTCHGEGGAGQAAFNLSDEDADNQEEADEMRIEAMAEHMNFMIPEASPLLRKPLGEALGGLSHVGGQIWTGVGDADYLAIYQWIASANPKLATSAAPMQSDLLHVNNYPNPFRDSTTFVFQLGGAVATKVDLEIYSLSGKLVRELSGVITTGGLNMGWNTIAWDGKDKNGKIVSNDTYFFIIRAEFGDGVKKTFRGKCVKVG